MKEQVNIHNYEAFYLDFIEGNLDETTSLALQDFLAEHPELEIDDDFEPVHLSDETLSVDFKNQLRVFDADETICLDNVENFMIAFHEGLLSAKKRQKLSDFISHNEQLKVDFENYGKVYLHSEKSLVFPNKSRLKQTRILPLFIRFASIAAVFVFIYTIYNFLPKATGKIEETLLSSRFRLELPRFSGKSLKNSKVSAPINSTDLVQFASVSSVPQAKSIASEAKETVFYLKQKELHSFASKKATLIAVSYEIKEKEIPAPQSSYLAMDQMRNPIKPITNTLSDLLKQTVDFRTSVASEETKQKRSFYLKIGRFEITRNIRQ